MTNKRRRRRSRTPSRAGTATSNGEAADVTAVGEAQEPEPFPTEELGIIPALRRGAVLVGSSAALVVIPLVFPLVVWLVLVLIGLEAPPASLVDVFAIPPISTIFDIGSAQSIFSTTPASFAVLGALFLIRALVVGPLIGMVFDVLEGARPSTYGILRGLRAVPTLLAVDVVIVGVTIVSGIVFSFLGPGLSFLGSVAVPVSGLYFLAFAPASAVREGRGIQTSITRSFRAARMRLSGGSHFLMCLIYYLLTALVFLLIAARLSGGTDATANPSTAIWVLVLVATFIHMVFLAAFCARWLSIEPEVPEEPVRRRPPARERSRSPRSR